MKSAAPWWNYANTSKFTGNTNLDKVCKILESEIKFACVSRVAHSTVPLLVHIRDCTCALKSVSRSLFMINIPPVVNMPPSKRSVLQATCDFEDYSSMRTHPSPTTNISYPLCFETFCVYSLNRKWHDSLSRDKFCWTSKTFFWSAWRLHIAKLAEHYQLHFLSSSLDYTLHFSSVLYGYFKR